MKDQIKYVDDVLKQESFTAEELLNAVHRHPIRYALKLQWFYIKDSVELVVSFLIGKIRRLLKSV